MNELQAAKWLQQQAGMVISIEKNGRVALFMEGRMFCKGDGFLGAAIKAQEILKRQKKRGVEFGKASF